MGEVVKDANPVDATADDDHVKRRFRAISSIIWRRVAGITSSSAEGRSAVLVDQVCGSSQAVTGLRWRSIAWLISFRSGIGQRRRPAAAFSRAWVGLRAPQRAKVRPGWANVQAMTTCEGLAPCALANGSDHLHQPVHPGPVIRREAGVFAALVIARKYPVGGHAAGQKTRARDGIAITAIPASRKRADVSSRSGVAASSIPPAPPQFPPRAIGGQIVGRGVRGSKGQDLALGCRSFSVATVSAMGVVGSCQCVM